MVRNKVYEHGTKNITLSIDADVYDALQKKADELDWPLSRLFSELGRNAAFNDEEFAEVMAKMHCRQMNYWKAEKERIIASRGI